MFLRRQPANSGLGATGYDLASIQEKIRQQALTQGVPPDLALAVAKRESGFNQAAIGKDGELGIFQLMPATARGLGVNPADLDSNIQGGIAYLRQMYTQFGDWGTALAAYNCGPGNIASGTMCKTTPSYVASILGNQPEPLAAPDYATYAPPVIPEVPSVTDVAYDAYGDAERSYALTTAVEPSTLLVAALAAGFGVLVLFVLRR